jgi:hypothetical protein
MWIVKTALRRPYTFIAAGIEGHCLLRCKKSSKVAPRRRLRQHDVERAPTNQTWLVNASCTLIPAIGW